MSVLSTQTVEIGEVPVEIREIECCGQREWYGLFPPGLHDETGRMLRRSGHNPQVCCWSGEHDSFEGAVECAKRRVAKGFEVPA